MTFPVSFINGAGRALHLHARKLWRRRHRRVTAGIRHRRARAHDPASKKRRAAGTRSTSLSSWPQSAAIWTGCAVWLSEDLDELRRLADAGSVTAREVLEELTEG